MNFSSELEAFEVKIKDLDSKTYGKTVKDVKAIIENLYTKGYLLWPGERLQEAEFELSRLAEFLGEQESIADSKYSYSKDKYEQIFAAKKIEVRNRFKDTKEKFTAPEVEEQARLDCTHLEDKVNEFYADYKILKGTIESIQRVLLTITHRINELQHQMRFKQ